jgi:hypothetical protein
LGAPPVWRRAWARPFSPEAVLAGLEEALGGLEVVADGEGGYLFPWHLKEKDPFLAALLLLKVLL